EAVNIFRSVLQVEKGVPRSPAASKFFQMVRVGVFLASIDTNPSSKTYSPIDPLRLLKALPLPNEFANLAAGWEEFSRAQAARAARDWLQAELACGEVVNIARRQWGERPNLARALILGDASGFMMQAGRYSAARQLADDSTALFEAISP